MVLLLCGAQLLSLSVHLMLLQEGVLKKESNKKIRSQGLAPEEGRTGGKTQLSGVSSVPGLSTILSVQTNGKTWGGSCIAPTAFAIALHN